MLFGNKLNSAFAFLSVCIICAYSVSTFANSPVTISHAIAMHGDIKYPKTFKNFEYTNPNAPKGGVLKLGAFGTYDSFNPFIDKGIAPAGIGKIYDSLTTSSNDEAFTQYGLLAEKIELPKDRSWVTFHLNKNAKFSDGKSVTADDVVFSFNLLMEKGSVYYASTYKDVAKVEALDKQRVKYTFKNNQNKELALIVGQLPVLPKHFWKKRNFAKDTLIVPVGSGAYTVKSHDLGRSITYERNKDYWGKNLAVNKGKYNFNEIRYDYFKDSVALLEAFKSGSFDFRYETSSKQWATGYQSKSLNNGWFNQEEIKHSNPTGMQTFVMNLRKPLFQDIRVRKALELAFDFEWTNKNLFYGAYARNYSYFANSELAASGILQGEELALLLPYKDQLPASVFTQAYEPPVSQADGYNRKNLIKAKKLLEEAGWKVENNVLINLKTKQPFKFEITLVSPAFERIVNPFVKSLKKLGIHARVRIVEPAQFTHRMRLFEFDMIVHWIGQSLSPGNEQQSYWHSSEADKQGSSNYSGIKHPVVDALVEKIINAKNRNELIVATRALDRVLLHHHYTIPQWHSRNHRIAYWDKFSRPAVTPKYDSSYSTGLMTWWYDNKKAEKLNKAMGK